MSGVTDIEKRAAELSSLAYFDKDQGQIPYYKMLKTGGKIDNYIINKNAAVVLKWDKDLIPDKSCLIVATEGTNDLADFMSDIAPGNKSIPGFGGKARKGFYNHARSTWRGVRRYIRDTRPDSVVFTGHSLGGTSAIIHASLSMVTFEFLQNTMYCVTFGAPRCLRPDSTEIFDDHFEGRHTRFVMPSDPVPRFPTMFFYRHPDGRVLLKDKVQRDEISHPVAAWTNNVWNLTKGVCTAAKHHSMDDYRDAVLAIDTIPEDDIISPTDGYVFG